MNEVLKVLESRRSCRNFDTEKMIADADLQAIIKAGTYAATGMGKQSPIIIAVTNQEVRNQLSKENAKIMGTDSDPFYGAPVILIVLADKNVRTYQYDGSLVMGNMMNAAESLGISSIRSLANPIRSKTKLTPFRDGPSLGWVGRSSSGAIRRPDK